MYIRNAYPGFPINECHLTFYSNKKVTFGVYGSDKTYPTSGHSYFLKQKTPM